MTKYSSSGWHFQSNRHSNARRTGHAGGKYAFKGGKTALGLSPPKTNKHYVLARKLYDDDNKLKYFTFYPKKFGGLPPNLTNNLKKQTKVLGLGEIKPVNKVIYLDRWDLTNEQLSQRQKNIEKNKNYGNPKKSYKEIYNKDYPSMVNYISVITLKTFWNLTKPERRKEILIKFYKNKEKAEKLKNVKWKELPFKFRDNLDLDDRFEVK